MTVNEVKLLPPSPAIVRVFYVECVIWWYISGLDRGKIRADNVGAGIQVGDVNGLNASACADSSIFWGEAVIGARKCFSSRM
jgi:hypothetical protein